MSKKTSGVKNDAQHHLRHAEAMPPAPLHAALTKGLGGAETCEELEAVANQLLARACEAKTFTLTSGNCPGGSQAAPSVDLVIVIDTSGSMGDEATDLSDAAADAISAAMLSCPSDLRVMWFGIEGSWPGTNFIVSYRDYLVGLLGSALVLEGTVGDGEDGAAAVIDLSNHFDWRPGAARLIFYLGDEALEGGDPQDADDVLAADDAISHATTQGVRVFTYFGTGVGNPVTAYEYQRLAMDTGGQFFQAPVANLGGFQAVLEQVICGGVPEVCQTVEQPTIVPCLQLRWGDGPQDQLETEDTEVLCITVCNRYSNVAFKNFTLQLDVVDAYGAPVPNLPDGTPSVRIKPNRMIAFGEVPPCDPATPDQPSCVSREVVMLNRGAIEGKYRIIATSCFDASFTQVDHGEAFELELVRS